MSQNPPKGCERKGLTLKEESSLIGNEITSEVLTGIGKASDESSPQIGTPDQVEIGGVAAKFRFDLDSSFNHGENISGVLFAGTIQSLDRSHGFFSSTLSS
jgi:hypothetical protein